MSSAVRQSVQAVLAGFRAFLGDFNAITRRAPRRFETRDWKGCEADAVERLDVYAGVVDRVVARLRHDLGPGCADRKLWRQVKRAYAAAVEAAPNRELAETFFNSVSRRVFATEGVRPDVEFVGAEREALELTGPIGALGVQRSESDLASLIRDVLQVSRIGDASYEDLERDARLVATELARALAAREPRGPVVALEMLRSPFFRMKHAYLVGRARTEDGIVPLVLALLHEERGVFVDAALTDEDEISVLFSFTRAYFHVETDAPQELIRFIRSLLPSKPLAELYISLGFHKHGKAELFRSLEQHLGDSSDNFEHATGDPGMVMLVFTLPTHDVVLKVIRDRFAEPKNTTAQEVRRRYRIVFERDRVGRLVEAQEFEHLELPRERFSAALLEELTAEAGRTVHVRGKHVIIDHLYAERRVRPLNLHLREAGPMEARRAVIDYGNAIRELAAANIFPGDFLLKNFGVTRHGRVVFYDYDELCMLTDCSFRRLPPARSEEDELAPEPWFAVGENDIFPEEFPHFLGLPPELLALFLREHGELFDVAFWRGLQQRHRAGEVLDFYPYPLEKRLPLRPHRETSI